MTTVSEAAPKPDSVRLIFGAPMLVLLLTSLDQTIVSAALPTIVGDLGGVSKLSWVVTARLLASTVSKPALCARPEHHGADRVPSAAGSVAEA